MVHQVVNKLVKQIWRWQVRCYAQVSSFFTCIANSTVTTTQNQTFIPIFKRDFRFLHLSLQIEPYYNSITCMYVEI